MEESTIIKPSKGRTMPIQKPGKSRQDYGTPPELIRAVENRFGPLLVDLAASRENKKPPLCYTVEDDSLVADWVEDFPDNGQNLWLNHPFENIEPWAIKCREYALQGGLGKIFLLTPASVGSNWFRDYVDREAYVIFLNGRLTFEGCKDPYPKDCMLSVFGNAMSGYEVWDWRGQ